MFTLPPSHRLPFFVGGVVVGVYLVVYHNPAPLLFGGWVVLVWWLCIV